MIGIAFFIVIIILLSNLIKPRHIIYIHPPIRWGTPGFRPPRGRPPYYAPRH